MYSPSDIMAYQFPVFSNMDNCNYTRRRLSQLYIDAAIMSLRKTSCGITTI